jgi:eukaryotic-like serine/threonine-protein kinase
MAELNKRHPSLPWPRYRFSRSRIDGPMPAPATVEEFLLLLSRSGLLSSRESSDYLNVLRQARSVPTQPATLADQLIHDGLLTPFQARMLLSGRSKGFVLGEYRLLAQLGAGATSSVFLAEDVTQKRYVALKVLLSSRANDPACRRRFLREARVAASLDHPNLVHAYEIESDGSVDFLVMEYIDGVNLHELVARCGRLEPLRAAHYIHQAALGLQHAYTRGLVHRDIKPANLLVDRAGILKILDLGLARFYHDETDQLTREHDGQALLGTADYLAPEQGRDSHAVDVRADIYSLGATFFYLLLGRTLFEGGTLIQKLIWHQMKPPPNLRELRRDVPPAMALLVAQMLAKDPTRRPQTPGEVAASLTDWTQTPIEPPTAEELANPCPA